jgi:N-acyl-D-aspartate/D-glutamate deacylase
MLDLKITGGLVVDGTGIPGKLTDVGIKDGFIVDVGRLGSSPSRETIDAEGLVVAPGIIDAHTHYDPQLTWDPLADTSVLHGVTTVAAGNCGFSIAPCRSQDRAYVAQMFARVEGMDPSALDDVVWGFESFEEFLATRDGKLGINLGMYLGHSAIRRWVLGEEAHEREARDDEVEEMASMVRRAMEAGALGLSSSQAPTHLDLANRPVPSRLSSRDELRALADAVGEVGRGSIAMAPESAVEGISEIDRAFLLELAQRGGVPVITQGLGGRSKVDAPAETWEASKAFLDATAAAGSPVYSLLMTRALNGPFTLRQGSSRYQGVPLWDQLMSAPVEERHRRLADAEERARLCAAIDHPNRDPAVGSTLPPPVWESLRLVKTGAQEHQRYVGASMTDVGAALGVHPAEAMFTLALADDLNPVFHWSNETAAWRALLSEVQRHPQMIVGVSDGGAHLDFDDGAEWSSHFLATWWRQEQVWRLEEAIRLMTAIPAAILGLSDRGLLLPGMAGDAFIFDPDHIGPGTREIEPDVVIGVSRFRAVPEGTRATIVAGEVVIDRGQRTGARPGRVVAPR